MKWLFSAGTFTLQRVEQICRVLDIDLFELARLAHNGAATAGELSVGQEQALADSPRLPLGFHLLNNDSRREDIVAT